MEFINETHYGDCCIYSTVIAHSVANHLNSSTRPFSSVHSSCRWTHRRMLATHLTLRVYMYVQRLIQ